MKTRINERGITLIALVITIIVLLILAGISISMLSGENGILNQATTAKDRTHEKSTDEAIKLAAISALLKGEGKIKGEKAFEELNKGLDEAGYIGEDIKEGDLPVIIVIYGKEYTINENGIKGDTIDGVTIVSLKESGETVKENITLMDEDDNQIVIPEGFKIKSDSPIAVDKGIVVVAPDDSEFVWIPVKDVNKMATETSGTDRAGRTNYQGKLYDFYSTDGVYSAKEKTNYGQGTNGYREPSIVTDNSDFYAVLEKVNGTEYDARSDYYNNILGYNSVIEFGKAMQEDYNEMVESVKENKGFYVGRYETSINTITNYAQSISGATSATAVTVNTWYGLYKKEREYSKIEYEEGKTLENIVGSSMIWGSQYDQMLIWMQSNGIDVTLEAPINIEGLQTSNNPTKVAGNKPEDKLNNIYDLVGNSSEWTLEAGNMLYRIIRGGDNNLMGSLSIRHEYGPINSDWDISSRLSLYIK